jgi:hypothetical protein
MPTRSFQREPLRDRVDSTRRANYTRVFCNRDFSSAVNRSACHKEALRRERDDSNGSPDATARVTFHHEQRVLNVEWRSNRKEESRRFT